MGLRDLIARLRRLPNVVETVSTKVDLIEQQIGDLRQFVERTNSSLTSDLEAGRTATGQKFTELHGALDAQHESRKSIPSEVCQLLSIEIGGLSAAIAEARGTLANGLNATENLLLGRLSLIQSQVETFAAQITAISEALAGFEHRSSIRNGEISNGVNALHNAVLQGNNELVVSFATRLNGISGGIDAKVLGLTADIAELSATLAGRQGAMANEVNAILNAVLPQTQGFHSIEQHVNQLARSFAEAREIDAGLNMLMARGTSALIARMQGNPAAKTKAVLPPNAVATLAEQMTAIKKIAPNNFAAWHAAYEAGVAEGVRSTEGNLSHEGHTGAGYFRMFINVHARGRVLDIGCGPIAVPSYLNDWPTDAIAGIDPQMPFESRPFPFAQSFAESIPWPDASFETVVIGTSLDHIYLLDQALAEIKRVLVPAGRLLIWTALFDETPPYLPKGPKFTPPDSYHLFHPGRNWFYELFQPDYRLIERILSVANAELLAYELKAPLGCRGDPDAVRSPT
jgi:SAM-dependent methyltransferase